MSIPGAWIIRCACPGNTRTMVQGSTTISSGSIPRGSGRVCVESPAGVEENDYTYADNDLMGQIDPLGLWSVGIGGIGICSVSAGVGGRASGSAGWTIGGDGTICSYKRSCAGVQYGVGAGCGVSADVSASTGQSCLGTGPMSVRGCGGKAGVGLSGSYGTNGTGECSRSTYTGSVSGGPEAKISCHTSGCVMKTDCYNEPECCDTTCECGGCG
jgi:hypothetical protein